MSLGPEAGDHLPTDKPQEFRCNLCNARCTRSPDGQTEYGHLDGCPDRPDDWPAGAKHVSQSDGDAAEEIVTDGGTFDCDGCGEVTAVSKRWRYMYPDQPDVGPVQYDDLCPQCATGKPSPRLFRPADDQQAETCAKCPTDAPAVAVYVDAVGSEAPLCARHADEMPDHRLHSIDGGEADAE